MRRILYCLFIVFSVQAMDIKYGFGSWFKRLEIFGIDYDEPRECDFWLHKQRERVELKRVELNGDQFRVCEKFPEIFTHLWDRKAEDWYDVLGVRADASEAEIRKAAQQFTLKTHPDTSGRPDLTGAFMAVRQARKNGLQDPDYCVVEQKIYRAEHPFEVGPFRRYWELWREEKPIDVARTSIDTIFRKEVQDFIDKVKQERSTYVENAKDERDQLEKDRASFDATTRGFRIFSHNIGRWVILITAHSLMAKVVAAAFMSRYKDELKKSIWRGDTEKASNLRKRIKKTEYYQKIIQSFGPILTFGSGVVYLLLGSKNGRLYKDECNLAEHCIRFNSGVDEINKRINQANVKLAQSVSSVSQAKDMGRDMVFKLGDSWYCCNKEQYDRYAKTQCTISTLYALCSKELLRASYINTSVGAFLMGTGALWGLYTLYRNRKQSRATKEAHV